MNLVTATLTILVATWVRAADPVPYPIDFRDANTLKEVFDAGLRPWRTLGLEKSKCEIADAFVGFSLPGCRPFTLSASYGEFNILQGNTIYSTTIRSGQLRVSEAASQTKQICAALGIATEGLDSTVAHLPKTPTPGQSWSGRMQNERMRVDVTFDPVFPFDGVAAHILVSVTFEPVVRRMRFLTEAIQPPSGYEHVSMDPPPRKISGKPVPEHGPDYYRKLFSKPR